MRHTESLKDRYGVRDSIARVKDYTRCPAGRVSIESQRLHLADSGSSDSVQGEGRTDSEQPEPT